MNFFNPSAMETLLNYQNKEGNDICISILMPTHQSSAETLQGPIRLKNLLGKAATQLVEAGLDSDSIGDLLAPASSLIEQEDFWQHQNEGLALYIGNSFFQSYQVPFDLDELVEAGENFYLKPLLPLVASDWQYYLLAASQNQVRLFEASQTGVRPIEVEGMPSSLAEALKYDDPEQQLQFHSSRSGGGAPVYHGQGGANDDSTDLLRFFQSVDQAICTALNSDIKPMIFVGVDYLFPIYQQASHYPELMDKSVSTNPDALSPKELREQTWPVAKAYFSQTYQQAKERYGDLTDSNQTVELLVDVLNAAHDGQIETLFIASDQQQWGTYSASARRYQPGEKSDADSSSLLNLAAIYTLNCGGRVFIKPTADMPTTAAAAAILRYPMPKRATAAAAQ